VATAGVSSAGDPERARRSGRWDLVDERSPRGGVVKAVVFLTHPGPSLLVTAVAVAATLLLHRHPLPAITVAALVLVVLPAQLATGVLNDWADAVDDTVDKPFKPIARGAVGRRDALVIALVLLGVCLGAAGRWGLPYLLIALLGAGSGVVYDLWLKRSPASVLCWWGGFEAVVLLATTAAGAGGALLSTPLSGAVAVALLVSNATPDASGDQRAGALTLPVVLGPAGSRALMVGAFAVAAGYVGGAGAALHLGIGALVSAAALAVAAVVGALVPAGAMRRVGFATLALLSGLAAVSWLAGVAGARVV
jgi:4-hydroxybenzoate polyprenyltransferase